MNRGNRGQLDLFDGESAKPSAAIIAFPLNRRGKAIRTVARTLWNRKTQEGKQAYWNRIIRGLRSELRSLGIRHADVEREIDAFRAAIGAELTRLQAQQTQTS